MKDLAYYIYAYVRDDGTPYYIGKGKCRRAWSKHLRTNGSNLVPRDNKKIVVLERNLSNVGACAIERRLIRWYGKKIDGGILLNLADGGDGGGGVPGVQFTKEHKEKLSAAGKGKTKSPEHLSKMGAGNRGKLVSEETKQKLSAARLGKKASAETRAKMSATAKNMSLETRQKLSIAAKNRTKRQVFLEIHCKQSF